MLRLIQLVRRALKRTVCKEDTTFGSVSLPLSHMWQGGLPLELLTIPQASVPLCLPLDSLFRFANRPFGLTAAGLRASASAASIPIPAGGKVGRQFSKGLPGPVSELESFPAAVFLFLSTSPRNGAATLLLRRGFFRFFKTFLCTLHNILPHTLFCYTESSGPGIRV